MKIGVPTEIKHDELRVGLTPAAVSELTRDGHEVTVQAGCGVGSGFNDAAYRQAGAHVVESAHAVFSTAELIIKVKEPQASECDQLRAGQILFTFLHLAAVPDLADHLLRSGATAIGYETVGSGRGELPLLAPMSEVAGRLAVQAGCYHLESVRGGRGVLLGGVPGVAPANVVIIGGGVVGYQAARMAVGLGARVTVMDTSLPRLRQLDDVFRGAIDAVFATHDSMVRLALSADLLIGAVLIPGASAPRLLERDDILAMQPGSVVVDVAIDQGGCFATSRPTTHEHPTYHVGETLHYCVANIPSAVARTSTLALSHATLPYVQALASGGLAALKHDPWLARGVNVHQGKITHQAVAEALDKPYHESRW
ncbi:alanine dehydrogenase [uncultured Gilvimarinus sp.]|uniref:alanine dehydrogenase n=1 Tax=uncultured Gilvimarinus sp. TaxID=1689143 RepID=UPI0030EDBE66|tara:strand:- start:2848 stop:3951 length:1104 start_codon:yes stop_codon:yes gene_type:complete